MYYTGTEEECNDYLQTVNKGENYSGTTTTWANVIKHYSQNLYAIVKHDKYSAELSTLDSLSSDWFPPMDN